MRKSMIIMQTKIIRMYIVKHQTEHTKSNTMSSRSLEEKHSTSMLNSLVSSTMKFGSACATRIVCRTNIFKHFIKNIV